ncbi:MAG: response regulator [Bdellovibrionales bacterium]
MKLLIADDHTLFRDALVQYIQRANDDCDIAVTKDFDEAYQRVQLASDYDLVILDLRMPGMNGLEGIEKLRKKYPDLKVALMSGVAEAEDVEAAVKLGACAYFPKTLSGKALVQAINEVLHGQKYIPTQEGSNQVMPSYYADEKRTNFNYGGMSNANGLSDAKTDFALTPRETEVLRYLANGDSNKDIANALGLQVVTVKLHVRGICRKLDANNRTQAALKATQLGLVQSSIISG